MTREQWNDNPGLRTRLLEVLREPVMSAALEILKAEAAPRDTPGPEASAVPAAMSYYFLCGFHRAFSRLESLAHPPRREEAPPPKPWEHLKKQTNA